MTADLREAFLIAAVEYVDWRRWNLEQSQWGVRNGADGLHEYWPEPTVEFFGRPFRLVEICRLARVLSGPLPPHAMTLFRVIDDKLGEPIPDTYPGAVQALLEAVEVELYRQTVEPIEDPPLVDRLCADSYHAGIAAALKTAEAGR